MSRPDLSFTQIATGDLDIPIVGQLLPANFPLSDEFEPSPVNVIAFDAPFWGGGLWKQDLEHAPGNTHDSLILADTDAELDDGALWVPAGVGRKSEKHRLPGCSSNVLTKIPQMDHGVESSAFCQLWPSYRRTPDG
jgi:hypothetical protein